MYRYYVIFSTTTTMMMMMMIPHSTNPTLLCGYDAAWLEQDDVKAALEGALKVGGRRVRRWVIQ